MSEDKKTFTITGMTCANCARTAEKTLLKSEDIKFAGVNLTTNTGSVVGKNIDIEKIKK